MAKPRTRKETNPEATESETPDVETLTANGDNESAPSEEKLPETGQATDAAEGSEPVVAQEPEPDEAVESSPQAGAAETEPEPAATPETEPKRRGVFLPLLLGGVCAAALGAGAVIYALPKLPPQLAGLLPQAETAIDPAELQAQIAAQATQIEALTTEIAALRAVEPPTVDLGPVQGAITTLETQANTLGDSLAALDARIVELEKRPVEGGAASASALEAFEREMQEMRGLLEESRSAGMQTQEQIAAAAAEAQAKIDAAEQEAAALRAEAEAGSRKALMQAGITRLAAALDSGAPTAPIIADLAAAGAMIPEALSSEVPSLSKVQDGFDPAARAALNAARLAATDGSIGERVGAFLLAQTGARSLTPQEGDGPDAVLSRARGAVMSGDLAAALAGIAVLPPEAQAEMAEWVAQAESRLAAGEALNALSASLN